MTISPPPTQRTRMWGRDLWLNVRVDGADLVTTPAGDFAIVEGDEALRQALIRRVITNPGEYAVLPGYGAGARSYVKERNTRAIRDELVERIRAQAILEPRVERVAEVSVETTEDGEGLKINLRVVPRGRARPDDSLPITLEVR